MADMTKVMWLLEKRFGPRRILPFESTYKHI